VYSRLRFFLKREGRMLLPMLYLEWKQEREVEELVSEDKEAVLLSQNFKDFINQRILVLGGKKYYK